MKILIICLPLLLNLHSQATTYYFASSGNDLNTGTSTGTAWQTLSKFNSFFNSLNNGDNLLFNKGDVFYGNMIILKSGTVGNPITIGAYGTGVNPVITGFSSVTSWTNLGGNIWESTSAVSMLATLNMVTINGVNTPMGRYPNSGWLTYTAPTPNSISTGLNSATINYASAEAVIRKTDYAMDRTLITGHSGTTFNYTNKGGTSTGSNNYGFFIQNDARTLDAQNEWYYNTSTKKIRIYSTSTPTNVKVATITNLVNNTSFDYITIQNISFSGSNSDQILFSPSSCDHAIIQNCFFSFSGGMGIAISGNTYLLNNNSITDIVGMGLFASGSNATITNNYFHSIGVIPGQAYEENLSRAMRVTTSSGALVQYNTLRNIGAHGISTASITGTIQVLNNIVDSAVVLMNDMGGIYFNSQVNTGGKVIAGNLVSNTIGYTPGTTAASAAEGFYLDELATRIRLSNNTSYNNGDAGFKMHKTNFDTLTNNTSYNNAHQQITLEDQLTVGVIHDMYANNNLFISTAGQFAFANRSANNDLATFFSYLDNNVWARPIDDNLTFRTRQTSFGTVDRTLAQWKTFSSKDASSTKSIKAITDADSMILVVNPTNASKIIGLPDNYEDMRGVQYNGLITVVPFGSAVLLQNGAITGTNIAPSASAGPDQTIQLPVNSVNLSGNGNDPDGSIGSYQWTIISGGGSLSNTGIANPVFSALSQGAHVVELQVTDNLGAIGKDTILVTVNPANVSPVGNAGSNQTITLPTNLATLTGSGTDADGSIAAYLWTQTSGTTATITTMSSSSTTITGLTTAGTRTFNLRVTDNQGATDNRTVSVIVKPAIVIQPAGQSSVISDGKLYKSN